jgi:Permuted papain-like amidase enzyme, YaeF/YiiX, C92 family
MFDNAGAEDSPFPMTVKAFFADADRWLNHGDILLSRSPFFASRMIRLLSKSFFSHAALIFLLPRKKDHLTNTFVIESLFAGVRIANLETYVSGNRPIEEVGILRLEGQGFSQDFFKRANGILLNEVNKPYDFHRLWRLALSTYFGLQMAVQSARRRPNIYRRWMPRQFICSGFIQFGIYQAALFAGIASERVVLKNGLDNPSPDEMMGTTPEDLATSDRLTWKYVIRRGWVYEANSYTEAKKLISDAQS